MDSPTSSSSSLTSPQSAPCLQHPPPSPSFPASLGPDPSFWAPYTPLTSKARARPLQSPIIEEIVKGHEVPFNLCILDEMDQLAIAYAFEERAIRACNLDIAARRSNQQIVLAQLDSLQAHEQLSEFDRQLDMAIIDALRSVAIAIGPTPNRDDGDMQTRPRCNLPRLPSKFNPAVTGPLISLLLRYR
jgi:hypothetical protein